MKNILFFLIFTLGIQFAYAGPNFVTLVSIPGNSTEFYNIFKRQPTENELSHVLALRSSYQKMENVYLISAGENIDQLLSRFLKEWADKNKLNFPKICFSIIGHNESGEFFFPDGRHIPLETIVSKLKGFPAMFLSCNAGDYVDDVKLAINFKITYAEAMKVTTDIYKWPNGCIPLLYTPREVAEMVIKKLNNDHQTNYKAKFLGVTGALGASFILLRQLDRSDEVTVKSDTVRIKQ